MAFQPSEDLGGDRVTPKSWAVLKIGENVDERKGNPTTSSRDKYIKENIHKIFMCIFMCLLLDFLHICMVYNL